MGTASVVQLYPETVGDRIRIAREAKGWKQADLARALGLSRAAVGQWEIDKTAPSISKMVEVAKALGALPEYIAFGTRPNDTRIVYRNPERDDIVWCKEIAFGSRRDERTVTGTFGIPADFLRKGLHCNPEHTILTPVNSHAVEPDYEYGDMVFVDTSDKLPSPSGVFLYWDGVGAVLGRMQIIPRKDPLIRITAKGSQPLDLPLSELDIIGRVKGRMQKA